MGRLGQLARHAFSEQEAILDDPQYITPIPSSPDVYYITTRKYLRQMICILIILFRQALFSPLAEEALREPNAGHRKSWHAQRWPQMCLKQCAKP